MKGRKPTPTNIKILTGNPGKRRLPSGEPVPESNLPSPPSHLDAYAREEWERLATAMHDLGILYDVDRAVFAAYCSSYSRWRTAEEAMQRRVEKAGDPLAALIIKTKSENVIQNPLVGIANKAAADMVRYAAEFGLTPSARARLAIDPNKKASKFDGLIGGKKNG
jgi:P27 family predicted phage terminase small subunit